MAASGVILSGGKSSRMKYNKAFADLEGQRVIDIIINKIRNYFDELIIITNEPELYQGLGALVYTDIFPGQGPIAGIHSALSHARNDILFLMACDMPFIKIDLIKYMINTIGDDDCIVPVINNQLQPLAAVYTSKCKPLMTECLENNQLKLTRVFEQLKTRFIYEDEMKMFGDVQKIFFNVNDPAALEKAREMVRRTGL